MPGRRYTGRPPHAQPPNQNKSQHKSQRKQRKRAQNALAIAEAEDDETPALRRSRYGDVDAGVRKRQRDEDDQGSEGSDEDGDGHRKRPKASLHDRYGKDAEYGSDSEGNEWVTGQVNDEDDESLDSDEAFGESDEERYEGFTFRGSKSNKPKPKKKTSVSGNLLDESADEEGDEELDSDAESENFAENAVDLHTMLDNDHSEDESEAENERATGDSRGSKPDSAGKDLRPDHYGGEYDRRSELSIDEDDDDDALGAELRSQAVLDMVAGLGNGDQSELNAKKARDEALEALEPSGFVSVEGFMEDDTEELSAKVKKGTAKGVPGKVEVPLPERQQGRLDRAAAFDKSKETLARWIDTVKQNRRAEHLSFPLINRDELGAKNTDRLKPLDTGKPFNELEATIQSILVETGMKQANADSQEDDEDDDLKLEGAPTIKPSLEEVLAQRAELRKARELIFREEIRAKRIKKIKSKSYRRVHRKARERELLKQQEVDAENGVVPEEDDVERLDRLRAEERMGAKHRESKWAKAMKATGRTAWDEDARNDMLDMARREEELKRRIHGQAIGGEDSMDDESSDADDSDEDEEELQKQLFRLREEPETKGRGSKLANMKFMQKAEAAKREMNEATIAQIQRELEGRDDSSEDSDAEGPGRRRFGPQKEVAMPGKISSASKSEFEEREGSEVEDIGDKEEDEIQVKLGKATGKETGRLNQQMAKSLSSRRRGGLSEAEPKQADAAEGQETAGDDWISWLQAESKQARHKKGKAGEHVTGGDIDPSKTHIDVASNESGSKSKFGKAQSKQVRLLPSKSDGEKVDDDTSSAGSSGAESNLESNSESEPESEPETQLSRQRSAVQRAFAGDEVVASFEAEKSALAKAERTPSPEADIMPGWGTWTGQGLSKREKRDRARHNTWVKDRHRQPYGSSSSDIFAAQKGAGKPRANGMTNKIDQTRRDANLANVIISERRPRASSAKYLASALPHPFENRAQYERSLRIPVGPEWTTKESFQRATKPRVILGGGVIGAMEKPSV